MQFRGWVCAALLGALSSCSEPEAEMEPDYDSLVLLDDLEEEWVSEEEKDRKFVAEDRPDPQELLIVEPLDPQVR